MGCQLVYQTIYHVGNCSSAFLHYFQDIYYAGTGNRLFGWWYFDQGSGYADTGKDYQLDCRTVPSKFKVNVLIKNMYNTGRITNFLFLNRKYANPGNHECTHSEYLTNPIVSLVIPVFLTPLGDFVEYR